MGIDLGFTEEPLCDCEYSFCRTFRESVGLYALDGEFAELDEYRHGEEIWPGPLC